MLLKIFEIWGQGKYIIFTIYIIYIYCNKFLTSSPYTFFLNSFTIFSLLRCCQSWFLFYPLSPPLPQKKLFLLSIFHLESDFYFADHKHFKSWMCFFCFFFFLCKLFACLSNRMKLFLKYSSLWCSMHNFFFFFFKSFSDFSSSQSLFL